MPEGMQANDNGLIGSLFTGYGGLDLGVSMALGDGMRVAYTSDIEPGPCAIEAYHAEDGDTPNVGDITRLDPMRLPDTDVIAGGSPCTDISNAGKRAGMLSGTRSGLWSCQADLIRVKRPALVVWENVGAAVSARAACKADITVMDRRSRLLREHGLCGCDDPRFTFPKGFHGPAGNTPIPVRADDMLLSWASCKHVDVSDVRCDRCGLRLFEHAGHGLRSGNQRLDCAHTMPMIRALGRVLGDLANLGYDAIWRAQQAADIGAPHHRLRLFVTAWPHDPRSASRPVNRRLRMLDGLPPIRPRGAPWAIWDADRDLWILPQTDLFGEGTPFPGAWPKNGIMACGRVWHVPNGLLACNVLDTPLKGMPLPAPVTELLYTPKSSDALLDRPAASGRPVERTPALGTQVGLLDLPGGLDERTRLRRNRHQQAKRMQSTPSSPYDSDYAGDANRARSRFEQGRQLGLSDAIGLPVEDGSM